jgi:hypothetical protein
MDKAYSSMSVAIIRVVGEVLFLYGLLGWIYGVAIQLTYPGLLSMGLSHLIPWIRVDTFAIASFLFSIVGFFVWRLAKELAKS